MAVPNPTSVTLLPPGKDGCPSCATEHRPDLPHNAQSLYYQMRFKGLRGRWPTWADAVAHCAPGMKEAWKAELQKMGAWTEPAVGVAPIADPPAESLHQAVDMSTAAKVTTVRVKTARRTKKPAGGQ